LVPGGGGEVSAGPEFVAENIPKSPRHAPVATAYNPVEIESFLTFRVPDRSTTCCPAKVAVRARVFPMIVPETTPVPKHGEEVSVIVPETLEPVWNRFAESEPRSAGITIEPQVPFQFPVRLTGAVTVNIAAGEFPPPGGGLVTTTAKAPEKARSSAFTVMVS
jgi:hypothetical protein